MVQNFVKNHLLKKSIISILLYPFSLIYSFIMVLRRKFAKPNKTNVKVISIGNIVAGGSGKTPFCIFLCNYLQNKGFKVAVSHRGYKGKLEDKQTVISNYKKVLDIANDAGDEAKLLALKLPKVPVVVGSNRFKAINLVKKTFPDLDFVILDDSFQHLKVYHDFDFVVFNKATGIGNGFVFPAGILREPLTAVKYANCLVYNGTKNIKKVKHNKPIIYGDYKLLRIYDEQNNDVDLINKNIALISGIGNPYSFEKTVKQNNLSFKKHFIFTDHYSYENKAELAKINNWCKSNSIYCLLTTEKDYTKLKGKGLNLAVLQIGFVCNKLPAEFLNFIKR